MEIVNHMYANILHTITYRCEI